MKRIGNPDKGPTSTSDYSLGYESDQGNESAYFPGGERGNEYVKHQNEAKNRDARKLVKGKFTKIA